MYLIMSGEYIDQEMQSEFGPVPPAFLPLQNRRLFQHQLNNIPSGVPVSIVIPDSYTPNELDLRFFSRRNVEVLRIPDGISLGAAVVSAINLTSHELRKDIGVKILLGDTLIVPLPQDIDVVTVSSVEYSYNWTIVTDDQKKWLKESSTGINVIDPTVLSGFFSFSDVKRLVRCIVSEGWSFIEGLNAYNEQVELKVLQSGEWLDFGHLNTFFDSKSKYTTERQFNDLTIDGRFVVKKSQDLNKMRAEVHWYESLPQELKVYTPRIYNSTLNSDSAGYCMEYLYCSTLNELYVFAELPFVTWKKILNRCFSFLDKCDKYESGIPLYDFTEGLIQKTNARLKEIDSQNLLRLNHSYSYNKKGMISIADILKETSEYLRGLSNSEKTSVIHGDFCFSNILYDFRADDIRLIDPRGLDFDNRITLYNDIKYDIAKLSHSVIGLYDWIIAGYSSVSVKESNIDYHIEGVEKYDGIKTYFLQEIYERFGVDRKEVYALQIHLFLSMLPLHAEDKVRQMSFMANVYRLYYEIESGL